MNWQVCVCYANGTEQVLYSYKKREAALKCIDAIYSREGYPLHMAYVLRAANVLVEFQAA